MPDQKSTSDSQDVIWPFDANADHNAGYSSRSATIIKVEPLPDWIESCDTQKQLYWKVSEIMVLLRIVV